MNSTTTTAEESLIHEVMKRSRDGSFAEKIPVNLKRAAAYATLYPPNPKRSRHSFAQLKICTVPDCVVCSLGFSLHELSWKHKLVVIIHVLLRGTKLGWIHIKDDIHPFVESHWNVFCSAADRGEKWKRLIADTLSHCREFSSGQREFGERGWWRLTDPTADPSIPNFDLKKLTPENFSPGDGPPQNESGPSVSSATPANPAPPPREYAQEGKAAELRHSIMDAKVLSGSLDKPHSFVGHLDTTAYGLMDAKVHRNPLDTKMYSAHMDGNVQTNHLEAKLHHGKMEAKTHSPPEIRPFRNPPVVNSQPLPPLALSNSTASNPDTLPPLASLPALNYDAPTDEADREADPKHSSPEFRDFLLRHRLW